ncbi:MAG: hypothetical protein Kow00109_24180 [Acidobacteriota bacterium]
MLRKLASLIVLVWCVAATPVLAVHPEFHVTATVQDFLKGEFKGVALSSDGRLLRGSPLAQVADTEAAFIHSVAPTPDGGAFIGTGSEGKIYRLTSQGTLQEWATLEEPAVYALAVDGQGRLYAGTAPDGKVYRVAEQGRTETFFNPDEKFIWDLSFDSQGRLYVATGPQGIVYRVTPDGKGEAFLDAEEGHVVRLAWDLEGNLLAGSAPGGILFRVTPAGKVSVLLDSELEEVKAIAVDRYGRIYAGALAGSAGVKAETAARATASGEQNSAEEAEVESQVRTVKQRPTGRLAVYRIERDGRVETLYTDADEIVYDLLVRPDGAVLLATGNEGRVIAVGDQGFATLVADTEEEQITRLWQAGGRLWLASSNLGKVFSVGGPGTENGVYESPVVDAGAVARWGRIQWRFAEPPASPAAAPRFFVRVGNTAKPDRTWSEWQGPLTQADGTALTVANSRFLQWKAEFPAAGEATSVLPGSPSIEEVTVTYQQLNLAPIVTELEVLAPGVAFLQTPANPSGAAGPGGPDDAHLTSLPQWVRSLGQASMSVPRRRIYVPGARSFAWQASDPNGDDLVFDLHLKRMDQEVWQPLVRNCKENQYTIDGTSLPDGTYVLKVTASDRLSNPPGTELEFALISKPFLIANRAPAVEWGQEAVSGGTAKVPFTVHTSKAPLYQVEYRLDDQPWRVLLPADGIADSPREEYELNLEKLTSGPHTIAIRAVDVVGNIGTHGKLVTIP